MPSSLSDSPKSWSFEPTGRLVHLRWAVAEIGINIETPSAALDAAERALRIFSQRATALIESMDSDSDGTWRTLCYTAELGIAEARSALAQGQSAPRRARALAARGTSQAAPRADRRGRGHGARGRLAPLGRSPASTPPS